MKYWKKIKQYLISFLKDEVSKAGFEKVTVGLSGGLDSAVVAILCKEAFGRVRRGLPLSGGTSRSSHS